MKTGDSFCNYADGVELGTMRKNGRPGCGWREIFTFIPIFIGLVILGAEAKVEIATVNMRGGRVYLLVIAKTFGQSC